MRSWLRASNSPSDAGRAGLDAQSQCCVSFPRRFARSCRASFAFVAAAIITACSPHYASGRLGVVNPLDSRVSAFRADRETAWTQFRLGGGLNVVVVNPALPYEFAWRFTTGGISSSPTVMGQTILVSSNDHHLYAIDASTGSLRWRYHAENEVMSQPGYAQGLIYIGIGNSNTLAYYPPHFSLVGSGTNKVEAIDADDGIEQWGRSLDGTGMPSDAIVADTVVSADGNGTLLALDARTGDYRWHDELPATFSMTSVLDTGPRLYLTGRYENGVDAFRAADGARLWKHSFSPIDGAFGDDPLASQGASIVGVYLEPIAPGPFGAPVTYGSKAREHVYALDERTGRLLWDVSLNAVHGEVPKYNQAAIALIYGNRIYVGSAVAPVVTALDMRGHALWQLRVPGPVKGGMAALDGVVYFGDLAGYLWAVDARSGRALGTIATDMHFNVGSPIIVNGSLVIGGTEDVLAVPLADIRKSRQIAGITRLTVWEHIGRFFAGLIPHRDPHREASYYRR